jgi:hypothetical protein
VRTAQAYLNYGRWVAECPTPGCHDARAVFPEHPVTGIPSATPNATDVCANGHPFAIEMPPQELAAQISGVVDERPDEQDRAWYPPGHPAGLRFNKPTGQSIDDLLAENQEVAAFRAAEDERNRDELREALSKLGIEVRPDGSFAGSL